MILLHVPLDMNGVGEILTEVGTEPDGIGSRASEWLRQFLDG